MTSSIESDGLSEGDVFDILSNPRRRRVVHILARRRGAVTLDALARRIAAAENDIARTEVEYEQRKRVYTALQQSHLPTMDEYGIVRFNKDRGVIAPTDELDAVVPYLDIARGGSSPRDEYDAAAAAVCAAAIAAAWIGAWPFSLLTWFHWTVVLLVVFVASATVRTSAATPLRPT